MKVIRDPGDAQTTLVMLPGAGDRAQDLVDRGFIASVRKRGLAVDVLAVDADFDHYLDRDLVVRLERDIVAPARRGGAARIWLMGISLGGLGALSYAREHPGSVEGIVLLAPFLGTRGLIAEITRAGGLEHWKPGPIPPEDVGEDDERRLLEWLQQYRHEDPGVPAIWLGYGIGDRYAPASLLLAARLPAPHVMAMPGGHDWETWLKLWERWLDAGFLRRPRTVASNGKLS